VAELVREWERGRKRRALLGNGSQQLLFIGE